jgi:hypothetical protein
MRMGKIQTSKTSIEVCKPTVEMFRLQLNLMPFRAVPFGQQMDVPSMDSLCIVESKRFSVSNNNI